MSKINISFNGAEYSIDESSLSSATNTLKSHFSTVMNGSGAVIDFGGTSYNIDSTKLDAAASSLVSYFGTIAGDGVTVVVDGVEYNIDPTKVTGAIAGFEDVLGDLSSCTITWLDSDGVTVLKTEQVAYGSVPGYTPTKEGYVFGGWTPTPTAVTGDASYTAAWKEKITFAKGSWADIARISEAGEASQYFAVGDTRVESFGSYGDVKLRILGFDHDDLADGSGKAGMSIGMVTYITSGGSEVNKSCLVEELQAVMKNVTYPTCKSGVSSTTTSNIIAYSWGEVGLKTYQTAAVNAKDGCTKYAVVPSFNREYPYWCRGWYNVGNGNQYFYFKYDQTNLKFNNDTVERFMGHFCV